MDYRDYRKKKSVKLQCILIAAVAIAVISGIICTTKIMLEKKNNDDVQTVSVTQPAENVQTDIPAENMTSDKTIIADNRPEIYTYEDMEQDIKTLEVMYPQLVKVNVIGNTVDGRNLYDMVIGDINAPEHIMIQGSIHAREYMTSQLVMMQACDFIRAVASENVSYKNVSYNDLLSGKAIHAIPMVNPDGVSISQMGLDGVRNTDTMERLRQIASYDGDSLDNRGYLRQWKANANGVDLNRNFDALWEEYGGPSHASSDHYKGTSAGSENESAALISLTNQYNFVRTISYHTYGQVIYWYFGQTGELKQKTLSLAQEIAEVTGYVTDANYEALDPAGYKDWAISKKSIPSLTIEVGYGQNPLPSGQLEGVYEQNKDVWAAVLYNYMNN